MVRANSAQFSPYQLLSIARYCKKISENQLDNSVYTRLTPRSLSSLKSQFHLSTKLEWFTSFTSESNGNIYLWKLYKQIYITCIQPSITKPFAMSTPSHNERSPKKWFKQKFRSVFSSSRSPSRNLEVQSTRTNVPSINSPSDSPRISADRTGSG